MTHTNLSIGLAVYALFGVALYQLGDVILEPTSPPTTEPKAEKPQAAKIDKSPTKQAQRQKLIADLIYWGVFHKVETVSPTSVRVYVMPEAFNKLTFDFKQSYLSMVFAAKFDDMAGDKAVHVYDATNRNRLGLYLPAFGGLSLR
jgi:hypothetical protein